MKVATLGSGSSGNAVLVTAGRTRVLVDAGFSGVEIERRLDRLGVGPGEIRGLVVTHEHRDHTMGMGVAARRWGWPLYLSQRTAAACDDLLRGGEELRFYEADRPFRVAAFEFHPFLTCHDAADPLAVTLTEPETGHRLGIATDLGRPTGPVRHALRECHFLILEANHDEVMLRDGPYPWSVKQRIAGSRGHLSNRMAAELAAELHHPALAGVLLAHLSDSCNTPRRALRKVRAALERKGFAGELAAAAPDDPSRLYDVGELLDRLITRTRPQLELFGRTG